MGVIICIRRISKHLERECDGRIRGRKVGI